MKSLFVILLMTLLSSALSFYDTFAPNTPVQLPSSGTYICYSTLQDSSDVLVFSNPNGVQVNGESVTELTLIPQEAFTLTLTNTNTSLTNTGANSLDLSCVNQNY